MKFTGRLYCLRTFPAWLSLLFLLICASVSRHDAGAAPSPSSNAKDYPRASDIFSAASRAMGGEAALKEIKSLEAVADCTSPRGVKYRTELISARPALSMFKQSWPEREPFLAFVNGQYAWTREENGEIVPLDRKNAAAIRGHEFQMIAVAPQDRFLDAQVEGHETFAGTGSIKIRAVDEMGNPCQLFFDSKTHLMLGMIITNPVGKEGDTVKIVFNKWKRIGRVKLPIVVTATDRAGDFVFNFQSILLNRAEENIFRVPVEIIKTK